jgi:arylsulfatase A-like enzyme
MASSDRNLLLVHCHDLGRYLACYGRDVETPTIDGLASEGVRFENYHCTAPQCSPSRGSIMTGKHPHNNGMIGLNHHGWDLDDGEKTLPMYLGGAGYETHLFGLQHEANAPERLGYHEAWTESRRAPDVAEAVGSFLADRDPGAERPFFASVGFFEPHRLGGPEDGWGYHAPQYDAPNPDDVEPLPYLPDHPDIREELAGLYGMIRTVDDAVGSILANLDAAGLRDETTVVFTTDHGIAMPRAKGTCYESGVGTALVVDDPDLPSGEVEDALLSNVDLLPTLLDHLGVELDRTIDGRSFLPLLTGGQYEERDSVFHELTFHDKYAPMRAIRTEEYTYVRNFGDLPRVYMPSDIRHSISGQVLYREYYHQGRPDEELYYRPDDPHEQEDVAGDSDHAEALERLRSRVDDWMAETDDPMLEGDLEPPAEQVQRLKGPWG